MIEASVSVKQVIASSKAPARWDGHLIRKFSKSRYMETPAETLEATYWDRKQSCSHRTFP